MIERVRRDYYWTKQQNHVQHFVKNCRICNMVQNPRTRPKGELMPIFTCRALQLITSDVLGPLKTSIKGNKYVLVIIDHFSKFIQLYALPNQEATTIIKCLHNFVMKFGIPEAFLSDQGRNYQSDLIAQLWEMLDVRHKRTSTYHPETDGLSDNSTGH